jgi:putative ABC transport system substrate-binding protein
MEIATQSLNLELLQFPARGPSDFESAFEGMVRGRVEAVSIDDEATLNSYLQVISALALNRRLATVGGTLAARRGGLIGYGVDFAAMARRAATFVDKILKGAKPAELPVEQASRFDFVLNLKTAKALGIDVATATLLRATEVIE